MLHVKFDKNNDAELLDKLFEVFLNTLLLDRNLSIIKLVNRK